MRKVLRVVLRWARRSGGERPILKALLIGTIALAVVTTFTGFAGLNSDEPGGNFIAFGLAVLISVAAALAIGRGMSADTRLGRTGWILVWICCAYFSASMSYAFWFQRGSSQELMSRSAREAAREAAVPLSTFAANYADLAGKADALRALSAAKEAAEFATGGTCEAGIGPTDGPRRRLRNRDAARFEEFAKAFAGKRAELDRAGTSLDGLYAVSGSQFYKTASVTLDRAYATTVAAAQDPNLSGFRVYVTKRIEDGRKPMVDPQSGEVFTCPDSELEARMEAARAVQLPAPPAKPPTIAEPTLAAAAARPFVLMAHPRRFSLDLDLRPILLGVLVDLLQAVLAVAVSAGGNRTRSARGDDPQPAGGAAERLADALEKTSSLAGGLQRLGYRYAEPGSWMRVLESHSVSLPTKRRGGPSVDYFLAPAGHDARSLGAKAVAIYLSASGRASLHHVAPFNRLPARWQEKLRRSHGAGATVEIYELEGGLLNELLLDAASFDITGGPRAANADVPPGAGDAHEAPHRDEHQLRLGF